MLCFCPHMSEDSMSNLQWSYTVSLLPNRSIFGIQNIGKINLTKVVLFASHYKKSRAGILRLVFGSAVQYYDAGV